MSLVIFSASTDYRVDLFNADRIVSPRCNFGSINNPGPGACIQLSTEIDMDQPPPPICVVDFNKNNALAHAELGNPCGDSRTSLAAGSSED